MAEPSPSLAWDPHRYGQHAEPRLLPARDLLARVSDLPVRHAADLGCGAGGPTRLLAERFPEAAIVAVDAAPAMLAEAAREPHPRILWTRADLARWRPAHPLDLVFSNAALHWLPDHATLFPRLLAMLRPGGVLAVQMPDSHDLPSHRIVRAVLAAPAPDGAPFGSPALRAAREHRPLLDQVTYRTLCAPLCREVAVWGYEYHQRLEGEDAVLGWLRGTLLVPILEELAHRSPDVREAFLDRLRSELAARYPPDEVDGTTPFLFPRTFVVALRC